MRVLIVEDSEPLRESLKLGLEQEGFAVDSAADGAAGLGLARNNPYDVLVLDLLLPKLDGLGVLAGLRDKPERPHVLVLTARDRIEDRVAGLNQGADDYLVKPFAFDELLARVHALVRRRYEGRSHTVAVGELVLDLVARTAVHERQALELTTREYALLEYLALRRGQQVSREEIEDHIYGVHKLPSSNAVDSTVCLLRAKLGPGGKDLIRTLRGRGYVLDEPRVKSIRRYLLSRLVAGAALVLALAGGALYLAVTRALEAQYDQNLVERVHGFASILFQTADEVEFEFSEQLMPEYGPADEHAPRPDYFELWLSDGKLLERSDSLAGADLVVPAAATREPAHWDAPLPDGRAGRFVSQLIEVHHVFPEEGPDRPQAATILVTVARGREELVAAEQRVLLACAASFLALIVLIAAFSWLAVERGLEPAKRLAARLDAIEVERLPEHLDVGELPVELAPVAGKTDLLIRRVAAALERERRTTADIAHELRTPLSELRTVSEVALRDGKDPQGARRALETVRDVAARMGRSVATLLELARLEMGAVRTRREPVDLGALVAELLRTLTPAAGARGVNVRASIAASEVVAGDPEVLRIVVSNLLGNSIHYATPASTVFCRCERRDAHWRFVVENRTEELEPADLHALAQPFWRKDRARTDRSRTGLGLALSRALAEKAGCRLTFELEEGTLRAILAG